jgi:hypothetical protein
MASDCSSAVGSELLLDSVSSMFDWLLVVKSSSVLGIYRYAGYPKSLLSKTKNGA